MRTLKTIYGTILTIKAVLLCKMAYIFLSKTSLKLLVYSELIFINRIFFNKLLKVVGIEPQDAHLCIDVERFNKLKPLPTG